MNTAQFISHHLFVAAAVKPAASFSNSTAVERPEGRPVEDVRTLPLEVIDHSEPLPASLLRTLTGAAAPSVSTV